MSRDFVLFLFANSRVDGVLGATELQPQRPGRPPPAWTAWTAWTAFPLCVQNNSCCLLFPEVQLCNVNITPAARLLFVVTHELRLKKPPASRSTQYAVRRETMAAVQLCGGGREGEEDGGVAGASQCVFNFGEKWFHHFYLFFIFFFFEDKVEELQRL